MAVFSDTFKNCPRVAISKAHLHAFFDIRRHDYGTIFVTGYRSTHDVNSIALVEQREFQRVVNEVFVILDIQIAVIDFISGLAIQFIQHRSPCFCHYKFTAKGFPANHMGGMDKEVFAPH